MLRKKFEVVEALFPSFAHIIEGDGEALPGEIEIYAIHLNKKEIT